MIQKQPVQTASILVHMQMIKYIIHKNYLHHYNMSHELNKKTRPLRSFEFCIVNNRSMRTIQ